MAQVEPIKLTLRPRADGSMEAIPRKGEYIVRDEGRTYFVTKVTHHLNREPDPNYRVVLDLTEVTEE